MKNRQIHKRSNKYKLNLHYCVGLIPFATSYGKDKFTGTISNRITLKEFEEIIANNIEAGNEFYKNHLK